MKQFLIYLFWPNPGNADYGSPKVVALLVACGVLIGVSFVVRFWRSRQRNAVLRKLSRSWASACLWFGITGLILVVARVEMIQYVAMRVWWGVWLGIALLYVFAQVKLYRMRYYEVLPTHAGEDPRDKYLPKRRHR